MRTEINIVYSDILDFLYTIRYIRFELHIVNEIVFFEIFYSINSLAN